MNTENLFYLLLTIPAFITGLTFHEFAHAWMANRLGDDTPRRMGRLTLDPLAHLDPLGCLMFVVAALSGVPLLGWAKPVPFNPRNLDHPRRDQILIAVAGPISNLLQVPIWLFLLWLLHLVAGHDRMTLGAMLGDVFHNRPDVNNPLSIVMAILVTGVRLNITLAAFNMIPIPPLDGHYVLEGLGPPFVTDIYNSIRPFAFLLLFVLIQTPIFDQALAPFEELADQAVVVAMGFRNVEGGDFAQSNALNHGIRHPKYS